MKNRHLYIFGIILLVVGFFLYKNTLGSSSQKEISGVIDLNGTPPNQSTISIAVRPVGASQFDIVAGGIQAIDGAKWRWTGAKAGTAYEIQAYLESDSGINLAQSSVLSVTAPASDELLRINVSGNPNEKGTISGTFNINGSIPSKSSISIVQRKQGEQQVFTPVVNDVVIKDGGAWTWGDAQQGVVYEIKGYVMVNNTKYAESANIIAATAPASNEILTFNLVNPTGTVVTPTKATISGAINLNGSYPQGSNIAIGERVRGQSNFNIVVSNLALNDGVSWSWNNAQTGVIYDIQAYIQSGGNNIASSEIVNVAAPASNEILHFNASSNLPVPPNNPGIRCLGKGGNGNWNINVSYHSVNGANLYWIKIGDSSQDNRFVDSRIPPNNQQLPTTYNFNTDYLFAENVTYYAKYAFSNCSSCGESYNFSPFTPTTQFSCGVPTNTPAPTHTPKPKPTDTPVPTPKIAQCNQTCGSNGYQCASGLECISHPGVIGSDVCRNPSCPDDKECDCKPKLLGN